MKTLREMDTKKLLVTFLVALTAGLVVFGAPPDSQAQVTIGNVKVTIGGTQFALWSDQTLNAGESLVLAQNPTPVVPAAPYNFDSSDSNGYTGGNAVVSGTATGTGCSNFSFNDSTHVLTVANADPSGFAFNEAQDYSKIGSFLCGGLVITVSVGYADNAHSDDCGSDATLQGLHGSSTCFPSNGPWPGTLTPPTHFQGSGQFAPTNYPAGTGPHAPCDAADTSATCFDSGVILFTAANAPQLKVVKTPKTGVFTAGQAISFDISVSNPGLADATNVMLTDTLPTNGGLTWVSNSTTPTVSPAAAGRSCTLSGGSNQLLSCKLGTISPGTPVTVHVDSNPTPAGACQDQPNLASATADLGLSASDTGDWSCTPPPPQLKVVKSPKKGTFTSGSQISYTIVVSNPAAAGGGTATNVQLTDALPGNGGLVWQTATTTQGTCVNPIVSNNLSCSLGNLAPGASASITVASTATTPAPACQDQPNPDAHATANGGLVADDSGDQTCQSTGKSFTIGPSSMEGAIKISNGDWVNGGYSFQFKNGNHIATNYTVNAFVTLTGPCSNGGTDTVTVPLGPSGIGTPTGPVTYTIAAGDTNWDPPGAGDQNDVRSWDGSVQVGVTTPLICGGIGTLDASKGAVYHATVSQSPATGSLVAWRFKYRDPAAKGKPNTNCLNTNDPNRAKADVCGASWSETKTDP